MEDDDEFGDLYTDVLGPFTTSFLSQPQPTATTSYQNRPIDLNTIQTDDEEILFSAPTTKSNPTSSNAFVISQQTQQNNLAFEPKFIDHSGPIICKTSNFDLNLNEDVEKEVSLAGIVDNRAGSDLKTKVLEKSEDVKLRERDSNFMEEDDVNVVVDEREYKDILLEKDGNVMGTRENIENSRGRSENSENFEIVNEIGEMGSGGVLIPGVSGPVDDGGDGNMEDDWDSDSEDDLQIVLNDSNHGPMGMERIGGGNDDDEDEDGEPLVIVADGDDPNHQPIVEEQDWGEQMGQADGERKELTDAAKVNGGVAVAPKIGFNNLGYYPFHSQFKYVRPGAAPVGPGGAPGQVRPPVNIGPIAGRGRGDWRPTGIRSAAPMQKGYGMPVWGNNAGRGFGTGLDFTLPSHKTIFEVDIGSFEEKPWKLAGIDISDFFNFGLNEESWKEFCKQLEQFRLGTTMQSKIHVYESGRTEQDFDPDMPPELAAAAAIHGVSSDNANLGKTHAGQIDYGKGSANVRAPLPTGRAIQVESGYGERLPSIDTRPPRIRDSDAIIEIVLQDSAEGDSYPGNDIADNDPSGKDFRGVDEIEHDTVQEDTERCDGSPHDYDGRKGELVRRREPCMNPANDRRTKGNGMMPLPSEPSIQYLHDSRGHTPVYLERNFGISEDERLTKGRARDGSPSVIPCESTIDKRFLDNQKEESVEIIDGKHSPVSCPANDVITRGRVVEHKDAVHDELVMVDGSTGMEREAMALNKITTNDSLNDDDSVKKQKLSSHVEQSSLQDIDDREDSKAARSNDNSKARSGSSKDYRKSHDGVDEEVVQIRRSIGVPIIKRPVGGNENSRRRKGRDERQEIKRHHMTIKGREDSYTNKNWEPDLAHHSHVKTESIDRRKESANSDVALQRRDEDPHGRRIRADDARKREQSEEMRSRHRSKVRENERSDRDEHHQLKNNGNWRAHHDKDVRSLHREWDDNLKSRNENVDDLHSERRKEETQSRRDHTEKEVLHVHGENSNRRKRERDEVLEQRKRDDSVRQRDDDQHYVRHKEEGLFQRERGERQRERGEWHRLKQSHEESLSQRERDEGRGGLRSGRAGEDKAVDHSRPKDEYRGSDRDYLKDAGRYSEQLKRRDRVENDFFSQQRGREDVYMGGNNINNDERRARHERESSRNDRAVNASDNHRVHEKKQKENTRKSTESEGGDYNLLIPSKRHQEKHTDQIRETVSSKDTVEQQSGKREMSVNRQSSRKHREDDEQQDSRRGRSKMERWTSHKESDFSISTKSSSSLKVKEIDVYQPAKSATVETVDNQHLLVNEKEASDPDYKNGGSKPTEDRHLDTVAKLKKRSERFKLPMPSEKEAMAIKKMESEPLPSAPNETCTESEVKPERPARKRRWTSNQI